MRETGNYSGADILCRSALQVCPRDTDVHELIITALLSANHTAEAVAYYTSVAVALANTKDTPAGVWNLSRSLRDVHQTRRIRMTDLERNNAAESREQHRTARSRQAENTESAA